MRKIWYLKLNDLRKIEKINVFLVSRLPSLLNDRTYQNLSKIKWLSKEWGREKNLNKKI